MRWILLNLFGLTAFAATSIVHSTFDDGPGGWVTMGDNGTLRITREAADKREGQPALALDYEVGAKKFGAAILPVEPGTLAMMDQVHFWIKTDYPTSVAVILSERGGGNYTAIAFSPGAVWQEVKVEPSDFTLGERGNDPPDPDGRLDPDQVQGVGLADLGQLFGAAPPNSAVRIALSRHPGKHSLLISGFEVLGGTSDHKEKLVIDQFAAPQVSWLSPGGAQFRLDPSRQHAPGPAVEVSYIAAEDAIVFFARNLPPDIPANVSHISFDIASDHAAQFVFALQERGLGRGEGPRYNTVVDVRGGGKPDHRDLSLSAFSLDQNGPEDPYDGLKPAKAKALSIAGISAGNGAPGPNKVWLSNLQFKVQE